MVTDKELEEIIISINPDGDGLPMGDIMKCMRAIESLVSNEKRKPGIYSEAHFEEWLRSVGIEHPTTETKNLAWGLWKGSQSGVAGTAYTAMQWLERGVRHAIPRGKQDGLSINECLRWVAVRDAFGCGSRYAINLCIKFGLDPDETIKR